MSPFRKRLRVVGLCNCCSYPLRVTSVCRSPSFLNMSITVSIGVWSVTVTGARSSMRVSFSGGGPLHGTGATDVNKTRDPDVTPSCVESVAAMNQIVFLDQ